MENIINSDNEIIENLIKVELNFVWVDIFNFINIFSLANCCPICRMELIYDREIFIENHLVCLNNPNLQHYDECSICMTNSKTWHISCGHWFHIECIISASDKCPVCRAPIIEENILVRQVKKVIEPNIMPDVVHLNDILESILSILAGEGICIAPGVMLTREHSDNYGDFGISFLNSLLNIPNVLLNTERVGATSRPDDLLNLMILLHNMPDHTRNLIMDEIKKLIHPFYNALDPNMNLHRLTKFDIVLDGYNILLLDGNIHFLNGIINFEENHRLNKDFNIFKTIFEKKVEIYTIDPAAATLEQSQKILNNLINFYIPNVVMISASDKYVINILRPLLILGLKHLIKWMPKSSIDIELEKVKKLKDDNKEDPQILYYVKKYILLFVAKEILEGKKFYIDFALNDLMTTYREFLFMQIMINN